MSDSLGFSYEFVTYQWPEWLNHQSEKQREIWGYKVLFLDMLFPDELEKIIYIDADQVVRADLKELCDIDLKGAPFGLVPMCNSREETKGFRFWESGFWKSHLEGKPYHISALFVLDLKKFREMKGGDYMRATYQTLSMKADNLANLDQDLINHLYKQLKLHTLPQEWLWCETWCSDESLQQAKIIDLCNNPLTKEPKLARAKRQISEWTRLDSQNRDLLRDIDTEYSEQQRQQQITSKDGQHDEL